jgi:chloramphenicol-sensitive protein RarD
MSSTRRGVWLAMGAYGLWGVLPLYWKAVRAVPAPEILAHRILWSFLFLALLVGWRREWAPFRDALTRRNVGIYAVAAGLLSVNWLTYIWAVNASRIVETSLGYFINPLVSVALAMIFLRERLRRLQWVCVVLAGAGVVWLTWQHGRLPWVALVLAVSFALYGLLKKTAPLPALQGLTLETALLWLPALGFLGWREADGQAALGHTGLRIGALLVFTGVVTALPLLLFAAAARRVSLTTLGLLQYLAPSCQLLIGVAVYHEPFGPERALGFGLIWTALALYSLESVWRGRLTRSRPA